MNRAICLVACLLFCISLKAQKLPPGEDNPPGVIVSAELKATGLDRNGWLRFEITNSKPNVAYTIDASVNLEEWAPILTILGSELWTNASLPVVAPSFVDSEFYRVSSAPISPDHDNKNQVIAPIDPFLSPAPDFGKNDVRWIKFAIARDEPHRVYFQDSSKYLFHYDFASARLPQFKGMSREAFDQISLRTNNQQVVLGTVLVPSSGEVREAGIQFTGLDAYTPEQVKNWFEIVRAAIVSSEPLEVFYIPAFEQSTVAQANAEWFEKEGIKIATSGRWLVGDNFYSTGWAFGRLVFVPAGEIVAAYADGRLKASDILMTDGVPAEVPYVSGIISLVPATPNSHVAILARSYGIPFIYLNDPSLQEKALGLVNKEIILSAYSSWFGNETTLFDAATLDAQIKQEILAMKAAPPIDFVPKETYGSLTAATDGMTPADIKYFGGKASNYGFLRRSLATNSYEAIAISFDLWDSFLGQTMPGGKTLRQIIDERLAPYSDPINMVALRAALNGIRDLIEDDTTFTTEQMDAIKAALSAKFDQNKNIRFRSSTNLEDSETFTGAGLYDSYSGCLADDTDSDNAGPSSCDPTESKERGVFRAIRKVFASFYNENAYLERLRHEVNENQVGMAILVHHSSPDQFEAANGVATIQFNRFGEVFQLQGDMVSQLGAVSVTNPDGSALPEVVRGQQYSDSSYFELIQRSSLVPFGAYVMNYESDYKNFFSYFLKAGEAFQGYHKKDAFVLDFEFKKDTSSNLVVKQVREIPQPNQEDRITPFLLSDETEFRIFQGEFGDVFANHRLKSELALKTKNIKLISSNLIESFYVDGNFKTYDEGTVYTLDGAPTAWPSASHELAGEGDLKEALDKWTLQTPAGSRSYTLTSFTPTAVGGNENPFYFPNNLQPQLQVVYSKPVYSLDYEKNEMEVTNEVVRLAPQPFREETDLLITRTLGEGFPVEIETSFYWPEPPTNPGPYTAPLVDWVGTTITGLTTEPIRLSGYYSQTYRPGHHNFVEEFIFEPQLETGISAEMVAELRARDIEKIYFYWGGFDDTSKVFVSGVDGHWRPLK
ncbi:MAG: PEP/pyruvate-binding domain-containing protein [Verrucomicrobiales bacterium]